MLKNTRKYSKILELLEFMRKCSNYSKLPENARTTRNYAKMLELLEITRKCSNYSKIPENTRKCSNYSKLPENARTTRNYPKMLENTRKCVSKVAFIRHHFEYHHIDTILSPLGSRFWTEKRNLSPLLI